MLQAGIGKDPVTSLPIIHLLHGSDGDMKNLPKDLLLPYGLGDGDPQWDRVRTRYVTDPDQLAYLRGLTHEDFRALKPDWRC